jgi:ATP phosphoribosyltransferase
MVAGKPDGAKQGSRRRIATKFVNSAKRYYEGKGEQVEIIKLYGSMELGPIVGLADAIVDLVDTGNTLKANGLVPLEHIADISSRLIVNKASLKTKSASVKQFIAHMSDAVAKLKH